MMVAFIDHSGLPPDDLDAGGAAARAAMTPTASNTIVDSRTLFFIVTLLQVPIVASHRGRRSAFLAHGFRRRCRARGGTESRWINVCRDDSEHPNLGFGRAPPVC